MTNLNPDQPESQQVEIARLVNVANTQGKRDVFSGKRRWVRYTLAMRLEVTTDPNDPASTWPVTMHNISGGGFGFWSKHMVEEGTSILVREWSRNHSSAWLKAHVGHCTIGIRGYLVGALFEHPFPPDVAEEPSPAASAENAAVKAAARSRRSHLPLQTKCAMATASAGGLGALAAGLLCQSLHWEIVSVPMVGLATLFALVLGSAGAWLAVRGELHFLNALRTGIRQIAMREPTPMQLIEAPSAELDSLGQAFLDLGVTWRKHQEDERLARQKLEELNQIKSNILSVVSHDLRTPLTSILLYAQMLSEELRTLAEEDQRRFLGIISDECTRLARLVDDLLEIQRLEAGRVQWDMKFQDLSETTRACARLFEAMARSKSMEFTVDCPKTLPPVEADADKISQVISNLLSNSMKYTPVGGKVRLSAHVNGKDIVLSVADNGPGIPRDKWEQIFDRFAQLANPNVREIAGCGLGLYIVRQIVERHGGAVWVDSELGQGSEFFVSLPSRGSQPSGVADASSAPSAGSAVVCDADPELAAMIGQTLRQEKYEVRQAHSGRRLLSMVQHGEADVVIADVLMPDINAEELLHGLTTESRRDFGLVIHSYAGEGQELRRRGVDVFLRRPASKDRLTLAVQVAMSHRGATKRSSPLVLLLENAALDTRKLRQIFTNSGHKAIMTDTLTAADAMLNDFPIDVLVLCGGGLSSDWHELEELNIKGRPELGAVILCENVRHHERKLAETYGATVIVCRRGHEEDVVAAITAAHTNRVEESVT